MEAKAIDILTIKLRNAPQNILERVIGYVDALVEVAPKHKPYYLTNEQQEALDSQLKADESTYIGTETLYSKLTNKYEL